MKQDVAPAPDWSIDPHMSNQEENRIGRWSRRKTEAKKETVKTVRGPIVTYAQDSIDKHTIDASPPPTSQASGRLGALDLSEEALQELKTAPDTELINNDKDELEEEEQDLDILSQEHGLPNIDSLDAQSDFKPFMQGGIPDILKQAAMRRLWRIDKSFGFLDGMNDYDEDFKVTGKLITMLDTNYKIGRGFLDEIDEDDEDDEVDESNISEEEITNNEIDASSDTSTKSKGVDSTPEQTDPEVSETNETQITESVPPKVPTEDNI